MQGYPTATRCDIHHGQFRILYRRYTDASDVVNKMNGDRLLPTHEEIMGYTDWRTAMRGGSVLKASKRMYALFFDAFSDLSRTPVDEGHRARIRFELYIPTIPCAHEIVKSAGDPSCPLHLSPPRPTEELVAVSETDTRVWEVLRAERRPLVRVPETGNEDLIEILLAE